MNEHRSEETVAKAIHDLLALTTFAYEQGYHEMGYDPLKVVRDEIVRLREYEWMYKELQK